MPKKTREVKCCDGCGRDTRSKAGLCAACSQPDADGGRGRTGSRDPRGRDDTDDTWPYSDGDD